MLQFFQNGTGHPGASLGDIFAKLFIALLFGGLVAAIYYWMQRGKVSSVGFLGTLILLCILMAMTTQVIGDNVARAFSLVGGLSIVRFRTVVQDTLDTAFVIFAVILGMAAGSNHLPLALAGCVVVSTAAIWIRSQKRHVRVKSEENVLTIRTAVGTELQPLTGSLFGEYLLSCELLSVCTSKKGEALDTQYRATLKIPAEGPSLVQALSKIPGVTQVELNVSGGSDS